jgi:hypothetical protein
MITQIRPAWVTRQRTSPRRRELLEHLGGGGHRRRPPLEERCRYPALMVAEPQHVEEVHARLIHRTCPSVDSQRLTNTVKLMVREAAAHEHVHARYVTPA